MEYNTSAPTVDALADLAPEMHLEEASKGVRFLNYLIDLIGFFAGVFLVALVLYSFMDAEQVDALFDGNNPLLDRIIYLTLYVLYMLLIEGVTRGRSLGKWITGTKAVQLDGSPITWNEAFVRSICRAVPFEPLSNLGTHGWHDKWSNTRVVKVIRV